MSGGGEFLFVYGTLLSGDRGASGRSQRTRLAGRSRLVAAGTTQGRLVDLGRYPGLVLPGPPGEVVHGEVVELSSPALTLRWLDDYEGIIPGRHCHNEYERLRVPVCLADGRQVEAWAYVYRGPLASATPIPHGRWLR